MDTVAIGPEKLVLEDKPVMARLISYALVGTGVILILPNPYKPSPDYLMYAGIIMAMGGIFMQRFIRPTVKCVFDKKNGHLTIFRIRPFRGGTEESYPLAKISKIRIEYNEDNKDHVRYRLSLRMDEENWVPLTTHFTQRDSHTLESIAKKIQAFL